MMKPGFYSTPSQWFCAVHSNTMLIVRRSAQHTGSGRLGRRNPKLYCPRCGIVKKQR